MTFVLPDFDTVRFSPLIVENKGYKTPLPPQKRAASGVNESMYRWV